MGKIRRTHLGESKGVIAVPYRIDELLIVRTIYEAGMYVDSRIPERCSWADLESAHIQTAGEVYERDGKRPDTGPGWMSRDDHFVVEPGDYRRIFRTPGEYWCCLWTQRRGCEDVDTVSARAGELITLAKGESFFAVAGAFKVDGRTFTGPQLVKAASGPKAVVATTDTYAFTWSR